MFLFLALLLLLPSHNSFIPLSCMPPLQMPVIHTYFLKIYFSILPSPPAPHHYLSLSFTPLQTSLVHHLSRIFLTAFPPHTHTHTPPFSLPPHFPSSPLLVPLPPSLRAPTYPYYAGRPSPRLSRGSLHQPWVEVTALLPQLPHQSLYSFISQSCRSGATFSSDLLLPLPLFLPPLAAPAADDSSY